MPGLKCFAENQKACWKADALADTGIETPLHRTLNNDPVPWGAGQLQVYHTLLRILAC